MDPWIIVIGSIFLIQSVQSLEGTVSSGTIESDGMFTSSTDLERLLSTEAELVRALKDYVSQEEKRLVKLRKHISVYEGIQQEASIDVGKYIGNPINSYLLIKKLTSDWKEVKTLMSTTNSGDDILVNKTDIYHQPLKWPSEEDLSGAALALTRLQDTYNLDPNDLAHGKLNGKMIGPTLSAHDCFELGRQHYNSGDYDHTIVWMKEAQKRLDEESKGQETVDRSDILEYIGFSYYSIGDMKKALHYTNELLALQPNHSRAYGNKMYYEQNIVEENDVHKKGDDGENESTEPEFTVQERKLIENSESESSIYKKLCRGEKIKEFDQKKDLRCKYNFGKGNPAYLKIAPFKEEEMFFSPRIVLFHDVASKGDIELIKERATPKFKRATVQNYKTGDLETATYRISKTAWLKPQEHYRIANIYKRVGSVTGLNMETSEELQVSNYGIGGHYEPHFDFARREEKNAFASLGTGNRIATWLFYLSDVDMGGATVFPDLGVTLWPQKGDAVFWYNLYRNGEGDVRTRHAACPVLSGSKWVSNFWIHERGQEFTRPCSTSPAK